MKRLKRAPYGGWFSSHDFRVTKMTELHKNDNWSILDWHEYLGNKSIQSTLKYIKRTKTDVVEKAILSL